MSDRFKFPDPGAELQDFVVEWMAETSQKSSSEGFSNHSNYAGSTRVGLPAEKIDCYRMEALGEHEAVDPLIRQELKRGGPFRLIRVPCSIAPGPGMVVTGARVTTSLEEAGTPSAEIYSIFPTKLEAEGESESEISIGPSLDILRTVNVGGLKWVKKVRISQPRSLVTGLWYPTGAEWILHPANNFEGLEGTWNFLFTLRWRGEVRPLSVAVRVVIEATPRQEGFFKSLFLRSKNVQHLFKAWDPAACFDTIQP